MRLFGFEITKASAPMQPVYDRGWRSVISEPYAGAWQQNQEWGVTTVLGHFAVFACVTLIAADLGKLRQKLMKQLASGIWDETSSAAFSPVLRLPNPYQNDGQFREWWITSKLTAGNTYVLKSRDARSIVTGLVILDPTRTRPLVADDGSVFYECSDDSLNGISQTVTIPASEIIHDRMNCLFHPLVGISPMYAAALAAGSGLNMQKDSAAFFKSGAKPGGVIEVPGKITQETAQYMKEQWATRFSGDNAGATAILTEGMKFTPIRATAVDSQLVEQMKWNAEMVCSAFHVPAFKIGAGSIPAGQKVEDLNQIYYADCLQSLIEQYERTLSDGLGLGLDMGVELDLDGLLRMDTATAYATLGEGVKNAILAPNEARAKLNLKPLPGGDSVYMQQQEYSLEALAKRDAGDPFAAPAPAPAPLMAPQEQPDETSDKPEAEKAMLEALRKELAYV